MFFILFRCVTCTTNTERTHERILFVLFRFKRMPFRYWEYSIGMYVKVPLQGCRRRLGVFVCQCVLISMYVCICLPKTNLSHSVNAFDFGSFSMYFQFNSASFSPALCKDSLRNWRSVLCCWFLSVFFFHSVIPLSLRVEFNSLSRTNFTLLSLSVSQLASEFQTSYPMMMTTTTGQDDTTLLQIPIDQEIHTYLLLLILLWHFKGNPFSPLYLCYTFIF